ncbi:hypothetical protein CRG98_010249 [Punica granatum]|uniref:Uncharacterized protein n=1 Tax=Punica granatum TaxID=22663 RepID=A0A2I0KLI6_PUNGR|nr:hypothetical protein CRG98_010249 [Punica granatum]
MATPSHASPGTWTLPSHAGPDESTFGSVQLCDSTRDIILEATAPFYPTGKLCPPSLVDHPRFSPLHNKAYLCTPEFRLVGARMHEAYATRLGSIHIPGDARRTHVRRSRHSLFTTRRSRAVESLGSRGTGYT